MTTEADRSRNNADLTPEMKQAVLTTVLTGSNASLLMCFAMKEDHPRQWAKQLVDQMKKSTVEALTRQVMKNRQQDEEADDSAYVELLSSLAAYIDEVFQSYHDAVEELPEEKAVPDA